MRQGKQETDIHWKSSDGTGMFNWRMKFPLQLPHPLPRLKVSSLSTTAGDVYQVQIWDKDIASADDSIGECSVALDKFFRKAYIQKCRQQCAVPAAPRPADAAESSGSGSRCSTPTLRASRARSSLASSC